MDKSLGSHYLLISRKTGRGCGIRFACLPVRANIKEATGVCTGGSFFYQSFLRPLMVLRPHPYRVRSQNHGFSHGLSKCPPDTCLHQCAHWCRPFESRLILCQKENPLLMQRVFFLAEDEGFEPPQTESESGVLPLHKSSIWWRQQDSNL